MPNQLRAAAATIDITPKEPVRMDGYGGRLEPSRGVHDPLFARVLVLADDAGVRLAIVACDILGIHPWVTSEVRRLAAEQGIPSEGLILCATHNHAAPAGLRGGMFSRLDETLAQALVDRIGAAVEGASRTLQPATLKLGRATVDSISMNRRHPDWPTDPALHVLLIDGEQAPIATMMNFACHATVMSGANLMLSAEFPGAACRLLQGQTGAPALYLQGACGNVNPVWIRQDFESVERAGRIVGSAALRVVEELRALGSGQRAHNIRWDEFPEKPVPGRIIDPRLRAVGREIDLPLREFLPDADYASRIESLDAQAKEPPPASRERRELMAQLTRYQNERWAAAWARRQPERTAQRTEIQALSLGEGLALLALPGEFFVETAEAIRSRAGSEALMIACYANDYIGYVIPPPAYDEGGYEAGITFCTPEAEGIIIDASLELLRKVTDGN